MALDIRFNGIKPEEKCYRYSVQNNAENDKVFFILQDEISNIVSLKDLSKYDVYLKCESAGKEYLDKIKVECFYISTTNRISIPFVLPLKTTQYRNIGFQIQFQDANSNLIAQTEIVGMELCGTIKADEEIPSKYPSELVRIENELTQQGEELANHEERIETLEQQTPYMEKEIVVSDDVDSFENENGVDKLIRELESDGSVEKTFLIDKIYHEETKIEANPTLEEDNVYLDSDEFIEDVGEQDFHNVFGSNAYISNTHDIKSKYNDILGIKTFSIGFGTQGQLFIENCGNNPITIVFGKDYSFNEHGEKVLSQNNSLVSLICQEYDGEEVLIDSEYKEITIHANSSGLIEIEVGGYPSPENFVIYGFYTGTPAYTEYKKREIGKGGGGGSAVSNVEIKKIYLTYKDRMSICADYLGCVATNKDDEKINFINDSTRIYYNFETTIIDDKIEEEIKNGRFVIRLDYPLKNQSKLGFANGTHLHYSTARNGMGARGFSHNLKDVSTSRLNTLIFVEPKDIKINRYGEKYIHKRISFLDYINKVCNISDYQLEAITLDWINNDESGRHFFYDCLDQMFSCGIPHIYQEGDNLSVSNHIFRGSYKAKTNVGIHYSLWTTNRGFSNSAKLNPAFSCYSLLKMPLVNQLQINSLYFIGNHKIHNYENPNSNFTIGQDEGRGISRYAYMVARTRCAILSEDYENDDYSFLKIYPQADQQIRLYCKYILDINDYDIDYVPIFRTLITQK